MQTMYEIGLFAVAWVAGAVIGSVLIGNAVLSTSYGIPLSIRLRNKGLISDYRPMFRYLIAFVVCSGLVAASVLLVILFFPKLLGGFLFGLGIVIFRLSSENVRYSFDNFLDYIQVNASHFAFDPMELSESAMNEYFDLRQTEDIEGNQLFAKICGDLVSNSLFYGVLTVIVILVGGLSWWVGIILAGALAIVIALSTLQTVFLALFTPLGLFIALFSRYRKQRDEHGRVLWKESLWMTAAVFPRLIEITIAILYMLLLYRFFFPNS